MFFINLFLLALSWVLVLASERVIPTLKTSLSMSDQWITYLVFRPFHVILSAILFILAYLILRHVLIRNAKILFRYGSFLSGSRLEGILMLILAFLLVLVFTSKHMIPSLLILFLFAIYDGTRRLLKLRKQKKLRAVFRQPT